MNKLEYRLIQEHVVVGYKLLSKIPMYKEHAEMILSHHERYDGLGYPNGLKGDEISILSHILIVCDAFDAMTTNRIYKGRMNVQSAMDELKNESGKQFHPKVVESALNIFDKIEVGADITQQPETEVEKERFSYFFRDQVTGIYNYDYLNFILEQNIFNREYSYITRINLHGFHNYNTLHGWAYGDEFLNRFVEYLEGQYESATIFRVHNNSFILMTQDKATVDISEIEKLEFVSSASITVASKSLELKAANINNMEELEKSI